MNKELLINDIIYIGKNWGAKRKKAEDKLAEILATPIECEQCKQQNPQQIFWVIEDTKSGWLFKKVQTNLFTVCSMKCLLDRGLKSQSYYSLVVRHNNGEILTTGFQGKNAVAIREFMTLLGQ